MSTTPSLSPLKIVGKEFLIDENLLVSNYNPYDSRNPSGFDGLSQLRNVQGKLYVLDKTNFKEPTAGEFRGIKAIGDFLTGFRLVPGATLNYFSVNIDFSYDTTIASNPKRKLSLVLGSSTLSIIPTIGSNQTPDIFLDTFCLLVLDEGSGDTFHKVYTDIPDAEQKFMWIIPSTEVQVATTETSNELDPTKILNFIISNPTNQSETVYDFISAGKLNSDIPGGVLDTTKAFQYNFESTFTNLPDSLTWEQTTDLPDASGWSQYIVYKNFVYKFGGYNVVGSNSTVSLNVYRAPLNENGEVGTWELIGTTPTFISRVINIKDKIWIIGGIYSSGAPQKVSWYTSIKEDGTFETWTQGPTPLEYPSSTNCIVYNRLYTFGGWDGTNYHKSIQISDIQPDGTLSNFYKSEVSFPFNMNGATIFAYGNKIFIIPGYNRETLVYSNLIYSCVVNDNGTISTPKAEKVVGTTGYVHASFILGTKLYLVGGTDTGTSTYSNKVSVADLSIVDGQVQISDFRAASNFPINRHGDGVFITKNYVYLPAGREGTTWSNSKKLYRANISSYGNGKNDYSQDTYHYKNSIVVPGDQDSSVGQCFGSAKLKFQVPYYTNISDALNPVKILDSEILTIAKKLKLNNKYLDHLTLDDLDIPVLTQEQIDVNGLDTILNITINENSLTKYIPVVPVNPDEYQNNVSLLLNGEDKYDLAGKNFLEYNGNFLTNGIDTSTKKFGNSSMYFDGASWLRVLPSSYLIFGSKNFTVEFWLNCTLPATGQMVPIGKWGAGANSRSWMISINPNGELVFGLSTDGVTGLYSTPSEAGLIQSGTWAHIALTRNADSFDLWVNGIKTTATYNLGVASLFNAVVQTTIGTVNNSTSTDGAYGKLTGYIDGLRITEGLSRYQNNFTPPVEELLLVDYAEIEDTVYVQEPFNDVKTLATYTLDNHSNDLSGNANGIATAVSYVTDPKFGTHCAQFNGSTSNFVPYNLNPVGDFTVSLWLKISANITNTQNVFMRSGTAATGGDLCGLLIGTDNKPFWQNEYAEAAVITVASQKPLQLNKWHHIVITKTGEYVAIFMDGEQQAGSYSGNWSIGAAARTANPFKLGAKYISGTGHSAYSHKADHLRLFNGGVDQDQVNVLFTETRFKAKKLYQNKISVLEAITPNTQETLPINLTELTGYYQLPETFFNYDLAGVPGGTSLYEVQQLAAPQTGGICFSTGKKVYLYGGKTDNSTSVTNAPTNTLWVSNILNDGQLEGFTQVGTNTLNFIYGATYTYLKPDGTGWVYVFGGISGSTGTTNNSSNAIKRAAIQADGSIGTWEDHGTMPYSMYNVRIISHPEDQGKLYIQGGYNASAGVYSYLNTMKLFQVEIDSNGNVTFDNTKTKILDKLFAADAMTILKDPKDGFYWLFIFGTQPSENINGIFKIKIGTDFKLIGEPIKIGELYKTLASNYLIQDKDNVYIIGGSNNVTGAVYGASGFVQKFSKTELLNADYWHLAKYTMMPDLTIPISGSIQIETNYANYIICPVTTTNTTGTVYNWQSTGRILGFKKNHVTLGENGLILDNFNLELSKGNIPTRFIPNKLNARIREELFSNLMVKAQQTLTAYGQPIKFKDPVTNDIITLSELTNAVAVSQNIVNFIEWIVKLSETNNLDDYNQYFYTKNGLNTDRSLDIIIPEIIFNMVTDQKMFNINKVILEGYLTSNPPSTFSITVPGDTFDLDSILEVLFRSKSESSIITPAIYGANGLTLPSHNKFGFSKRQNDVKYLFIPQRTSQRLLPMDPVSEYNFLNYDYNKYLDTNSGCIYEPKNSSMDIFEEGYLAEYISQFQWFISPTGSNSNDGQTPETPKANFTGIPSGAKVCLLPGTYSGYYNYGSTASTAEDQPWYESKLNLFIGFSNHKAYGCGNLTIIDRSVSANPSTSRDKPVFSGISGELHNCKILYTSERTVSYYCAIQRWSSVTCYGVNFVISGYYSLAYGSTNAVYNNCIFNGGSRKGNYSGTSTVNTIDGSQLTIDDIKLCVINDKIIKAAYKFKPAYTLIPISDDEQPEDNSIVLEITQNFTNIPNLSYKL